jgi:hypothetical protein
MPIGFDNCVKNGGRIRTKRINANLYIHICFLNGKSFAGELKNKKRKRK